MQRCPSCGEENSDRARFCQNCATPLGEPDAATAEVRKVVTIVFADVTGSTALGERLDPEALRRVMGRYFAEMSAVVERHEGTVEKFIGDAVMAVFGIPLLHEDDALRAVRAAAGMRAALIELNRELERDHGVGLAARIGVNTGEVVAGDPTAGQRLVTGDAVNVAARLEQAAEPGQILLGDPTHRLVRDAVEVEPVAPLELKGKSGDVAAHRLVRVLEAPAGHARHLDSPMVGRAKELELLERALDRAVTERTSHLFTLLGPAGVGKSRLIQEFLNGPGATARVLSGRCLSYGDGITFYPLAEIVEEAAGITREDDLGTARSKMAAQLEGADDADRIVSLVGSLLAWGGEASGSEEAFWGVRKLLEHLARDRPVIVVLDDVHWAEPTLLDLIDHLADWTRDAALVLLCVARPELLEIRPGWGGGKLNATTILLEPLGEGDASELVDNLLGRADIASVARNRILEAAEGNPLFVEEMLGMLIDDGLLRFDGDTWRGVDDLEQVTVPPTIQLLLAARLDRLDADERAVMERGSVEGKIFHAGAVATLSPATLRPNVRPRLLALARKELIRPDRAEFVGEDAFRFRHLLIRDAAYQAMPKEQRADLHERYAGWLERAAGDRLPEYEEILAYHLEQAHRYRVELGPPDERTRSIARAAAARLLSSAERAQERGDYASAQSLLIRCAELSQGAERARALTELAGVLSELVDYQASMNAATDAVSAAREAGAERDALRAELVRIDARSHVDPAYPTASTRTDMESVLRRLEEIGDEDGVFRALLAVGRLDFYDGNCTKSIAVSLRLFEPARGRPYRDRAALAEGLGSGAFFGPIQVGEAFELIDRALGLLPDSIVNEAALGSVRAALLAMQDRPGEARSEMARARDLWAELGHPSAMTGTSLATGIMEQLLGRPDLAEQGYREGVEFLDRLGETAYNSTMLAGLASALCEQGRFDEAEEIARRSAELTAEGDFASEAWRREAQALVHSSRGEHDAAIELADAALGYVEPTDYVQMIGEAHEVRGVVLSAAGRSDEARTAFEAATSNYERKGIVPFMARIRERLASLEPQA
ncbi:MAG TPA: adenylate/guanylate cyclase domain-containing protein [Actinomycetota bacterium]|nr:adenylate/guanylate cyclase domain-containing protein [Actinomycetota bacterium]